MSENVALPPSQHHRKRKPTVTSGRALEHGLSRIYSGARDMNRLERARSPWKKRLMVSALLFFALSAAAAWGSFFFFRPDKVAFSGSGVSIVIDGPESVESAANVSYTIQIKNDEAEPLGSATLHVRLPETFHPDAVDFSSDVTIGTIPAGETKEIVLPGNFIATLGKTHDIQAVLTYRPADFNSEFQAVATKAIVISGSAIDVSVIGPKKSVAGEPVSMEVVVKNSGVLPLHDVLVKADYPDIFSPDKSTPASVNDNTNSWKIASLEAGKETKIRVLGTFTSAASGEYTLPFSVSLTNGATYLQEQAELKVQVSEGDLVLALIMNGKKESQTVAFGDTLRYAISYRNVGDAQLQDVSVLLSFMTAPSGVDVLLWNNLKDNEKGIRKGNTLLWTKKQVLSLGTIEPKSEGVIEITIPVLSSPLKSTEGTDYTVSAVAEATIGIIDGQKVKRSAKAAPVVASIHSDTHIDAAARYYDEEGNPIGSGPLPPKVGKPTMYHVDFTISNSLHELTDMVLTAKLPEGVTVSGTPRADAGSMVYDKKTNALVWTLNWMPLSVSLLHLSADVVLTPTKAMVGKIPNLFESISLVAKDKVLGETFAVTMPSVSASLEEDEKGAGKGKVE